MSVVSTVAKKTYYVERKIRGIFSMESKDDEYELHGRGGDVERGRRAVQRNPYSVSEMTPRGKVRRRVNE